MNASMQSISAAYAKIKVYITQSKGILYLANYEYFNITVSGIKFK